MSLSALQHRAVADRASATVMAREGLTAAANRLLEEAKVIECLVDAARASISADVATCWMCGCTDEQACAGGCWWVADPTEVGDLCSRCRPAASALLGGAP